VVITPVVISSNQYVRNTHPRLGDVVTWELFWGESDTWSQFAPGWSLVAEVRAADKPTTTLLVTTEEENVIEQPCIGSCGGVQFFFSSPLPIPETITVTGALGVTVGTPLPGRPMRGGWHEVDPGTLTTGTVRRLRVVSMAHARRPSRHPGWFGEWPVPGTEWVYDLAEPPAELHWYELAKNDSGMTRRSEVLLVDLET